MKKAIVYVFFTVLISYALREFLYAGVRKNKIGEYDKLNTIFFKKNNFNTIIIGSSRAESHIVPNIFDSISGHTSYNIGMEGEFMPVIGGVLKAYLENSAAPRNLILNIDYHPYTGKMVINRFPRFFPYLTNKPLYEALYKADNRFRKFKWLSFYSMPFFTDNYLNAAIRGYLGIESAYDISFIKGYVPVPKEVCQNMDTIQYKPFYSLPEKDVFSSLDSIVNTCKKNNINIVFFSGPIYFKGAEAIINKEALIHQFKITAKKNNIPYIDYTKDSINYNKALFADPYHLNAKGAEIFTRKFAADALQYLVK